MEIVLLIVFLILTVPVVLSSPIIFMATDSGVSGRTYIFIWGAFFLVGLYVYGMYKLYRFLQPYAEAIPNYYLWLIIPTVFLWSWFSGRK
jgi:hypothetical protein